MEELENRKRERMIRAIIFNSVVIIAIIAYVYVYVMPQYTAIASVVVRANETNARLSSLKKTWVDAAGFSELLTRYDRKKEVPDGVFLDNGKLNTILKKTATGSGGYLDWLISENSKLPVIESEIANNNRILGNIIPVYANSQPVNTSGDIDNQITLTSFISYVEKDILWKYELVSYAPLGLGNITFSNEKRGAVNIGSFQVTLDFKGKNNNIISLVDSLQQSWKLIIRNGKLVSEEDTEVPTKATRNNLSKLSNLLVSIKSLRLDNISPTTSTENNHGNLVLEFYVEGMNYEKILILRNILIEKFEGKSATNEDGTVKKDANGKTTHIKGLKENIKEKAVLCNNPGNPLCNETLTNSAVSAIKNLSKNVVMMQPKIDVLKKNELVTDITKEMDMLFEIKNSLESMEIIYTKNADILQKTKTAPISK